MKKIVLTGGGTAGHVTPNIALFPALKEAGYEISYIGSYAGMEKQLIEEQNIPYYGISSGKLRRYKDLRNLTDPFRVIKGYAQSVSLLRKIKPDVVFSKGGFVSVPVVLAAKRLRIPARLCGFTMDKPVILVVGGSSGSKFINDAVRGLLDDLLANYQIIHLCGKGNIDKLYNNRSGYVQFEYAGKELRDMFALSSLVISRAGANAICELLALHKPNILIPLSAAASRGDQILNARSFEKQGYSYVIEEENLTKETLDAAIKKVMTEKETYISNMKSSQQLDSIHTILKLIEEASEKKKKKA